MSSKKVFVLFRAYGSDSGIPIGFFESENEANEALDHFEKWAEKCRIENGKNEDQKFRFGVFEYDLFTSFYDPFFNDELGKIKFLA